MNQRGESPPPHVDGLLGYLGLSDWWVEAFSDEERQHIETVFQPLGCPANSRPLTIGHISASSETPTRFLGALIGWFRTSPLDKRITRSLASKLSEVIDGEQSVLNRHFGYQVLLEWNYRRRNEDPHALSAAITACERQIAISRESAVAMRQGLFADGLPRHRGFEQLAIIREKSGDFEGAIRIAEQANSEGWRGEWAKRIDRCRRRAREALKRKTNAEPSATDSHLLAST